MNVSFAMQNPGIHFQSKKWYGEQKTRLQTISVFSRTYNRFPIRLSLFPFFSSLRLYLQ